MKTDTKACEYDAARDAEMMERYGLTQVWNIGIRRPDGTCFTTSITDAGWTTKVVAEQALKAAKMERDLTDFGTPYVLLTKYVSEWKPA